MHHFNGMHGHHGHDQGCGCGGGGSECCGGGFQRKFMSKKEKLDMLKGYQAELEAELLAVKEKIKDLAR